MGGGFGDRHLGSGMYYLLVGRSLFVLTGVCLGVFGSLALPRALGLVGLERCNFQGRPIGSAGGLLFLIGAAWAAHFGGLVDVLLAAGAAAFGLLGLIDDRWGDHSYKGLGGHLRAAGAGKLTTGLVKAVGGGLVALGVAWVLRPGPWALLSGALIALCANLANLLDLRPLRTLKLFWAGSLATSAWAPPFLLFLLGLSIPYAFLEARRKVMLGDTGSNTLGAALGLSGAWILPLWAQGALVALLVLFHAWAERHSLTAWIEAHPWAKAIDRWGWNAEE
jgi:UDP-GlcNAc:undecaprenyl-phosphate GlcNAc-1-phosphate transferase